MPIFNRKYIFNPGQFFSIAMLVYQNVVGKPFNKWKLPKLDLHQNTHTLRACQQEHEDDPQADLSIFSKEKGWSNPSSLGKKQTKKKKSDFLIKGALKNLGFQPLRFFSVKSV